MEPEEDVHTYFHPGYTSSDVTMGAGQQDDLQNTLQGHSDDVVETLSEIIGLIEDDSEEQTSNEQTLSYLRNMFLLAEQRGFSRDDIFRENLTVFESEHIVPDISNEIQSETGYSNDNYLVPARAVINAAFARINQQHNMVERPNSTSVRSRNTFSSCYSGPESLRNSVHANEHNIADEWMNELCFNLEEMLPIAEDEPYHYQQEGTIPNPSKSSDVFSNNSVRELTAVSNQQTLSPVKEKHVLPQTQSTENQTLSHRIIRKSHSMPQISKSNLDMQICSEFDSTRKVQNKMYMAINPEYSATGNSISSNSKYYKQYKWKALSEERLEVPSPRSRQHKRLSWQELSLNVGCVTQNEFRSKGQIIMECL